MKRRIFTYSTFVLLLGLSACTQDGLPTDGAEGTPMTFTATGLDFPEARSRATVDGNWTGVSTVAVKIGNEVKDYTVTPSTDGLSATLTSTDPFYWTRTEPVTVSAWPKADASSEDMPLVVVQADQSGDGFATSDFIAAEPQEVSIGAPSLKFTHRTARLTVTLTPGDGINSVEGATVKLLGLNTTNGNPSSITAHHVVERAVYEALVAPQSIAQGTTFITVTLNGTTYSYIPQAVIELEAGNRYNYTVKVNAKGLELESVSGGEWTDSGTSEDVYTFYKSDLDEAEVGDYLTTDGKLIDGDAGSMLPDEIKAQIAAVVFWTPKQTTSEGRLTPASLKDDLIMRADYPNCTHGLAVALKDATYNGSESMVWKLFGISESVADFQSSENFIHEKKTDFKSIVSGTGATDPINYILGYQNTVVLRAYNTYCQTHNESDYIVIPVVAIDEFAAAHHAPTNSTGWFFPSPKELHILFYKDVDNIYNNSGVENYNIVNSFLDAVGGDRLKNSFYWSSEEGTYGVCCMLMNYYQSLGFIGKNEDALYVRLIVAF